MRSSSRLLWAPVLALACAPPEVELAVRVGPEPPVDASPGAGRVPAPGVEAPATAPAPVPASVLPTTPPATADELATLVAAVRRGPLGEISGPIRRIAAAPASIWPEVRALLLAPRPRPKGEYRSVLAAIGGDVPNRYGHFELAWKRAHGHVVKLSEDWLADLLALPSSRISAPLREAYRDAVLQAALLRAAGAAGRDPAHTTDVVGVLLAAAYRHEGTFRDEVGRALRSIGDEAVPDLVKAAAFEPTRRSEIDGEPARFAAYARVQLDRLGRRHPAAATEALAAESRGLARLLATYGEVRDPDAAEVLLAHADHPEPAVRTTARAAFAAYVDGPLPRLTVHRVRLLGGGTGVATTASYRGRAAAAVRARLGERAPDRVEPPCELTLADGTVDRGCAEQPARLLKAYLAELDAGRLASLSNDLAAALAAPDPKDGAAALDAILASDPEVLPRERGLAVYRAAAAEPGLGLDERARLLRKVSALGGTTADREAAEAAEREIVGANVQASIPRRDRSRWWTALAAWAAIVLGTARLLSRRPARARAA